MKIDFAVDGGVGARAVLGVVVLQTDETLEPEFARMMDIRGVALYHTRIPMSAQVRPDSLARMKNDLPAAVSLLPEADFDVIGYGCTSAAAVIGSDGVREAVQSVRPRAAVTDPLRALVGRLRRVGSQAIGIRVSVYSRSVGADAGRIGAGGIRDCGLRVVFGIRRSRGRADHGRVGYAGGGNGFRAIAMRRGRGFLHEFALFANRPGDRSQNRRAGDFEQYGAGVAHAKTGGRGKAARRDGRAFRRRLIFAPPPRLRLPPLRIFPLAVLLKSFAIC